MPFQPSRSDGRSDKRVVLDLVGSAVPKTGYTYEQITAALQADVDIPVDRGRVYRAVTLANKELLRTQRRYLSVRRGKGYVVLAAEEHLPAALEKKDRADYYIARGVELLRHARLDELTDAQRQLHEGQLLVLDGLYRASRESTARQDRFEAALASLTASVDDLKGRLQPLRGPTE